LVSRKSFKRILLGFILLTLVSVIFIILVVFGRERKILRENAELQERMDKALSESMGFGMEDFYLENQITQDEIIYPLRRPRRFWTRGMVDSYWIDPAEAGLQTLSEDNDMLILESLGALEGKQP